MEDGADSIITRSRKQFAAAVAGNAQGTVDVTHSTCTPGNDTNSSANQRVSANVISGTNNNFRQSPLHLLQNRLNAPPPELYTRQYQPHPSQQPLQMGRTYLLQPNQPMPRILGSNANYQLPPPPLVSPQQPQPFQARNHLQHPDTTPAITVKRKRGRPPLDGEFDSYSTPKISHVEGGAAAASYGQCDPAASVEAILDDTSQTPMDPQPNEPTPETVSTDPNHIDEEEDTSSNVSPGHVRLVDLPALLSNTENQQRELRPLNRLQNHQTDDDDDEEVEVAAANEDWPEYGMQMDCEADTISGGLIPKLERPDTPDEDDDLKEMYQKSEVKPPRSVSPTTTPAYSSVSAVNLVLA